MRPPALPARPGHGTAAPVHRRHHPAWRWIARVLMAGLVALAAWLLWDLLRDVDWREVRATLAAYPVGVLAGAAAFVVASYALYGGYDLLGRRYTHHTLPARTVAAIAFVVYASNLSLGPIVGSVGLRLRLYTRYGLRAAQVARIVGLGLVTNWSGYLLLAGTVLALRQVELPPSLSLGAGALQAIGTLMMALPLAYVVACARARKRDWHLFGHHFRLPHGGMAALQLLLSCANWAAIAGVIWVLLPAGLPFGVVLATFLTAAVVALATHIPGGLGVLEGVFLFALTSPQAPAHALLAGLLAFRALYYLVPLAVAGAVFLMLEARARRLA
jgi:uncharacterized membrane protein YbhN (UPF0104 family)